MKLVIDIEQEWYERACKATMSLDGALPIYQSIKEGTPYEARPQGEWKYEPTKGAFCSECGWHSIWEFNFCPECGAPMTEEAFRKYNGLKEGDEK